jgi:hypothetical protein
MAYHKLRKGTLQLRGMFSAEPFTVPPGGSPLLFQTGETYKGQPLIDHQHPHVPFMELSPQYTLPLDERGTWFTYFGYPGEPHLDQSGLCRITTGLSKSVTGFFAVPKIRNLRLIFTERYSASLHTLL